MNKKQYTIWMFHGTNKLVSAAKEAGIDGNLIEYSSQGKLTTDNKEVVRIARELFYNSSIVSIEGNE